MIDPSPDVARHRVSDLDKESAWIEKAATGAFSEIVRIYSCSRSCND